VLQRCARRCASGSGAGRITIREPGGRAFCYAGPAWNVRASRRWPVITSARTPPLLVLSWKRRAVRGQRRREGLRSTRWPARLEQFGNVYVDGAHNPHAARAIAQALPPLLARRPLHLVFGALEDKDAPRDARCARSPGLVHPLLSPDSPGLCRPSAWHASGPDRSTGTRQRRWRRAQENGVILCCGSLFLAGRRALSCSGSAARRCPANACRTVNVNVSVTGTA